MTFPIYNLPNGNTFTHRDSNTGKFWTHDNGVWTPKAFTEIDDLFDVFTKGNTESTLETVREVPRIDAPAVNLTNGSNIAVDCVYFEIEFGHDIRSRLLFLEGISRDDSMTNGSVYIYFYKRSLRESGATFNPGVISYAEAEPYFLGGEYDRLNSFYYTNFSTDPSAGMNFYYDFGVYSDGGYFPKGEKVSVILRPANRTNGDWYYSGVANTGYRWDGYSLSGGPVDYSKLQWTKSNNASTRYKWKSDRPDYKTPYNLLTRQTVDPTPADLTTWQSGTHWTNSTTGRVWIHAESGSTFDGDTPESKWVQLPVYSEHRVKNAIAQISAGEPNQSTDPSIEGDFIIDTNTNQLKLYDGTSWIVL